ncbi:hypothetical protein C4D60_Mb04t26960 [Musa balbisiana]|uniref:HSF-type DNA-binding domain-containing protein n=1 Tax=Musa balbisiana TaxID=52838 RepID=A0A4S8KFH6_MUSBA|nr:hypothetical protein C4D60_Mb04t26960 [Musa balbisiana]
MTKGTGQATVSGEEKGKRGEGDGHNLLEAPIRFPPYPVFPPFLFFHPKLGLPSREIENLSGGDPAAMAPPPLPSAAAEKAAEQAPTDGQRSLPTPFLTKTYQLVDDPSVDDMISWNEDGSTFVVWRPAEFARDLLPKYFKHNNFSSFVRQLNTYGFRKIVPDRWEFANDCFRRGEKRLLCDIHRRKITQAALAVAGPAAVSVPVNRAGSPANSGEEQVLSSNSSPGPPPSAAAGSSSSVELTEENERLRKENTRLSRELAQMKSLCSHISVLISKYADEGGGGRAAEAPPPLSTVLELMPARRAEEEELEEEDEEEELQEAETETGMEVEGAVKAEEMTSARLFGVSIGGKRAREEDKAEDPTPEVKSEPSDPASDTKEDISPERHQRSWVVYCPRPVRRACHGAEGGVGDRDGSLT